MALTRLEKIALGISGITALGIGVLILVAPLVFYAGYGISIGNDVNLLSELRAQAAGLAALGVLILAGILRSELSHVSIIAALLVFLAFPTGRLIGLAVDGIPSSSLIDALIIELVIAGFCLAAFRKRLRRVVF